MGKKKKRGWGGLVAINGGRNKRIRPVKARKRVKKVDN